MLHDVNHIQLQGENIHTTMFTMSTYDIGELEKPCSLSHQIL